MLPTHLWPQFYAHATILSNVLPIASKGWKSPLQILMEYTKGLRPPHSLPDLSGFKTFGVCCIPHDQGIPCLQKMLPRARIGILVGMHNDSTNDYLIWIPSTNKIEICRDVIFDENKRYDPSKPICTHFSNMQTKSQPRSRPYWTFQTSIRMQFQEI